MYKHIPAFKALISASLLSIVISGCATSRSEISIQVPPSANPASKHFARIGEVRDLRKFTVNPDDPSLPSIGNAQEISNPAITSRAIARKRNTYGQALGDVVLPVGQSVSTVVADAARKALREKGYAVVDEGSPEYANALPLSLDVEQFWAWFKPGFWAIELTHNADLRLRGSMLIDGPEQLVHADASISVQGAFDSTWQQVTQNGVNALVQNIKAKLRDPNTGAQSAQLDAPGSKTH